MTTDNDATAKRLGECTDAAIKEAEARDALKVETQLEGQVEDAVGKIDAAVEAHKHHLDMSHTPYQDGGALS